MNLLSPTILILLCAAGSFTPARSQEATEPFLEATDEREDGLGLAARYYPSYASNNANGFVVGIMLWNSGDMHEYVYQFSGKAFDPRVSIRLISPSGKVLTAYKDMPGAKFPQTPPEKMYTVKLTSGGYVGSFSFSEHYPVNETGEYRCTLSKRVYRKEPNNTANPGSLGTPVDLVTPEFKFRIEAIDPKYHSGWADLVPALKSQSPGTSAVSSTTLPSQIETQKTNEAVRSQANGETHHSLSNPHYLWFIGLMAAATILVLACRRMKGR